MISFHKAEAADRVWAHEILKNCEYPGAEYAFSCMYLWSDYFGELGRVGDHLTQHASWRGREVYLYPAGAGDIKGAIEAIRADAAEHPGWTYVVPKVIFNDDGVTLDDATLEDMGKAAGAPVSVVSCNATGFLPELVELARA